MKQQTLTLLLLKNFFSNCQVFLFLSLLNESEYTHIRKQTKVFLLNIIIY